MQSPAELFSGRIRELDRLDDEADADGGDRLPGPARASGSTRDSTVDKQILDRLDAEFGELRASADIDAAFDPAKEDAEMPALLAAGLDAWIRERGDRSRGFYKDPRRADAALHACLRMVSEDRLERQRRWAFRAVTADNPRAVQSRIKKAVAAAGLNGEKHERQLFLLRNTQWPTGPRTQEVRAEFEELGGTEVTVTTEDLKTFSALRRMIDGNFPDLDGWLAARQPAHRTELFAKVLADVGTSGPGEQMADVAGGPDTESVLLSRQPVRRGRRPHRHHVPRSGASTRRSRLPAPACGDLRRFRVRQDGPAAPGGRRVCAARGFLDRP